MEPSRKKFFIWIGLFFIVMILAVLVANSLHSKKSSSINNANETDENRSISTLPQVVLDEVNTYIAAREDSVGVDQTSPTSWLDNIKTITTPTFYSSLVPDPNSPTSSVGNEYYVGHTSGYIVDAVISGCTWDLGTTQPKGSLSSVYVFCNLVDSTIDRASGGPVSIASMPFGWTHYGTRPSPTIGLVKDKTGKYLINEDTVGRKL
jgi:hypothetical protein